MAFHGVEPLRLLWRGGFLRWTGDGGIDVFVLNHPHIFDERLHGNSGKTPRAGSCCMTAVR